VLFLCCEYTWLAFPLTTIGYAKMSTLFFWGGGWGGGAWLRRSMERIPTEVALENGAPQHRGDLVAVVLCISSSGRGEIERKRETLLRKPFFVTAILDFCWRNLQPPQSKGQ
jgi:hypothetical protein